MMDVFAKCHHVTIGECLQMVIDKHGATLDWARDMIQTYTVEKSLDRCVCIIHDTDSIFIHNLAFANGDGQKWRHT